MRRTAVGIAAALFALALVGGTGAGATGLTSENVEYVSTVPFDAGLATGARRVGDFLYVAGSKSLSIYDVSEPTSPALLSITPVGFQFASEDVDTNGKVLVVSDEQGLGALEGGRLRVFDVNDKSRPVEVAELAGLRDHTFSCVFKCRWVYGSRGSIVDLGDPASPELAGSWATDIPSSDGFDVTEVAPGRILTSTRNIQLLDARRNPAEPRLLAAGTTPDHRLIHSNRWPRRGRDRFFLAQGETPLSGRCNEASGAFMTWDASRWRETHSFSLIDEFRVANGTLADGNPPAGVWGCTVMWFQEHPSFSNGGLVVAGFFEHGARFLSVDRIGEVDEIGYFTPIGGETIATYWITDDIVYALDMHRGIDILRFTEKN